MTPRLLSALLALALLGPAAAGAAPRSEDALRACLKANLPTRSFAQDLRFTRRDREGAVRKLAGTWHWRRDEGGNQAAMLRLSAPADLAGASYLLQQKGRKQDFYVYLPAVRKVRKLTGAAAEQTIFDTGLSAFDLKFLVDGMQGGSLKRTGGSTFGGRSVEAWRYLPPADPNILYDRIEVLIDDAWCLPLQAKLYGGVPWKTLSLDVAAVERIGSRWQARRATVSDQREGSSTTIEMNNTRIDVDLPEAAFDPRRFYR